jgi:serine protease Do
VGILSATNRAWGRAVQTDASVSPANYGGPLIDLEGRVIGVLAPLPAEAAGMMAGTELYDSGIGFAVPLEDILRVLPRLQAGETLSPGIIGIGYTSRDPFTAPPVVASCRAESPAGRAGLRAGDRIVEAGGHAVSRVAELRHAIAPLYAGDAIDLVVQPGQEWYDCGDLVFRRGPIETLRLSGVSRPEPFRQTCLKVRQSYVSVKAAQPEPVGAA